MTHFTVLVKIPKCKNMREALDKLENMLEPYSENLEVTPYKDRKTVSDVYRMFQHYIDKDLPDHRWDADGEDLKFEENIVKNITLPQLQILMSKMDDWDGREGGLDEEGLYTMSTYNPDSKWDWYSVGGRWKGMLVPNVKGKSYGSGYVGESGVFNNESMNEDGRDILRADQIDFDKTGWIDDETKEHTFYTHAVLDEHGWHEASKMGWFAVTYDETEDEDTWRAKFKERWLTNLPEDSYIAIVDCHI